MLDVSLRRVRRGRREISLSEREAALLELFLRSPGKVVTRHAALSYVWGGSYAATANSVDKYVSYLRRKLGDPPLIETVRGAGFMLRS